MWPSVRPSREGRGGESALGRGRAIPLRSRGGELPVASSRLAAVIQPQRGVRKGT